MSNGTPRAPVDNDGAPHPDDQSPPSPRAFAIGTGIVFQSVGTIFLLGACCFWSFSGHLVRPAAEPAERWTDHFARDRLPAAAVAIGVATTLVGGIGLVAAGVGLYGEQRSSGRVALAVTGGMGASYWVLFALLIIKVGSWSAAAVAAVFAIITTILFLLAGHSASTLRRFPPPPDQNAVTEPLLQDDLRS